LRFEHQRCAPAGLLHSFAGAADVEIDLIVAGIAGHTRSAREIVRLTATEL
jgi:hypothetical protein